MIKVFPFSSPSLQRETKKIFTPVKERLFFSNLYCLYKYNKMYEYVVLETCCGFVRYEVATPWS